MKLLVLFLFVGLASAASFSNDFDKATHDVESSFFHAQSLRSNIYDKQDADDYLEQKKQELAKNLRERLNQILENIKEALDDELPVKDKVLEKLSKVWEKMKKANIEIDEKTERLLQKIRDKAEDVFNKLIERLGDDEESTSDDNLKEPEAMGEIETYNIFLSLKDKFVDKLKELKEKMKNRADVHNNVLSLKDKFVDKLKELKEKMKKNHAVTSTSDEDVEMSDMNIKEMLRQLKEHLLEKMDAEYIKQIIEKLFGQGSELVEQLLKTLREKGRERLRELVDRLLGEDETDVQKRGLSELWQKIKDYFKDLHIDLKEKFAKFGEWIKKVADKGIEGSKNKFDAIRVLGQQFIKHAKGISKEIADEAVEFFRQYKDELGELWDEITTSAKEALKKNKED